MPQIPIYIRKQTIPGESVNVPMDLGTAGLVGESIARLGKTGVAVADNLSDVIIRRDAELKRQNDAMAVLKTQNAIDGDTRAFKQSYDSDANKGDYDPAGLQEFTKTAVDKFQTDLDTKYLSNVSDPAQKIHIETYRNAAINDILDHTSVYQANARKDFAKVETVKSTDLASQNARDGITDLETSIQTNREKLTALHATGAVSAPDMEEIIIKADQQIAASYLDGLIARDPIKAREEIKSGKYNQYLPENSYRYYQNKAESLGKAEEKAATENTVYRSLLDKYAQPNGTFNTDAALQELQTSKNIAGQDMTKLDLNTIQNIGQSLRGVAADQQSARKKVVDGLLSTVDQAIINDNTDQARATITKLMADPDNIDMMDELRRSSQTIDAILRHKDAETRAADRLKREQQSQGTALMANDLYSGKFASERDVINSAGLYGIKPQEIPSWVEKWRGNARYNGMTNYWPTVIGQIEADAKKIDDVNKYRGQIINSIEYYRQHPQELDKSLGDQPIAVHNPRILDLYSALKEKADKAAFFGYDFLSVIKSTDTFVKPAAAPINAPALPPGKKAPGEFIGTRSGKNVYKLPNGKWQIGD